MKIKLMVECINCKDDIGVIVEVSNPNNIIIPIKALECEDLYCSNCDASYRMKNINSIMEELE